MIILLILNSFILASSFSINDPAVIDTGIYNRSYPFKYNSQRQFILYALDNHINIYDSVMQHYVININTTVEDLALTNSMTLLVTSDTWYYEYDLSGKCIGKYVLYGFGNNKSFILINKNGWYYPVTYFNYFYDVTSCDNLNKRYYDIFIDEYDLKTKSIIDTRLNIGSFSGNLLVSSINSLIVYDRYNSSIVLNISIDQNTKYYNSSYAFEINNSLIAHFSIMGLNIYNTNGSMVKNCSNIYYNSNVYYYSKYNLLVYIQILYYSDKKNSDETYTSYVPYIMFSDLSCNLIYKFDFGTTYNDSQFYNQYINIDENNSLVIVNINNEIKIWELTIF